MRESAQKTGSGSYFEKWHFWRLVIWGVCGS